MSSKELITKVCTVCGKKLNFEDFLQINPSLRVINAKYLYESPLIIVYCSDCYFERPEKLFKQRRRDLNYYCHRGIIDSKIFKSAELKNY